MTIAKAQPTTRYEVGQLVKHVHTEDPRFWIEAIVMRDAPEAGEGFYQVLVLALEGYTVVEAGQAAMTRLSSFMDWKVVA